MGHYVSAKLLVAALALAALAWVLSGDSIYALAVLVVATPCPLILATPIAIMSGIDLAALNGIIAKSGATIEQLGEVDIAVFDKTGTLTLGTPKVTAMVLPEEAEQSETQRDDGTDEASAEPRQSSISESNSKKTLFRVVGSLCR